MLRRLLRRDRGSRRGGGWRAPAAVLVSLVSSLPSSAVGDEDGAPLAMLAEPAITESSGLAASRRSPGVLWTVNDSGGGPFLYATDRAGRARGTIAVAGADNVDWEDLAVGPGTNGEDTLYVAETGDNARQRDDPAIYRVAEPTLPDEAAAPAAGSAATAFAERFPLVFPDGPRDVEALLVHPATGEVVLVSKEMGGDAVVSAAALGPGEKATLERVGELALPGIGPAKTITADTVSADTRRVALRTPFLAYEWTLGEGEAVATGLTRRPRAVALPPTPRGEAIAYGGDGELLVTSEGSPCPLSAVATGG